MKKVLVTGGAGYVGGILVPKLLKAGYGVIVLDWYLYREKIFKKHSNLQQVKGDIRDEKLIKRLLAGCDFVLHLACISNDPSFEL
ncbi:NAD-dependent epimerase/dehydratase family protein, partial [Candidatus Gottesmanbacteria bacterium]|nr:NAD-dependent epimerase/dehydratase family protein [Candidatus Gottesmanbacteria bacterium]